MLSMRKIIGCISFVMVNSHESTFFTFMVRQVQATRMLWMKYGYGLYFSDNVPEDIDKQEGINFFGCSWNARLYGEIPFRNINKVIYIAVIQKILRELL